MSRTHRFRTTGAAVVIGVLVGALALSGCGAGQIASTAQQVGNSGGADATAGTIDVRDANLETGAAGDEAALSMRIINSASEIDSLVSASSPAARTVEISGTAEIPGGQLLVVDGAPAPTAAAPTSDVDSESAPAQPEEPAPTGQGGEVLARVVLVGLAEELRPGLTHEVVLTFARAGEVTLDVPVEAAEAPREDEPAPE